MRKKPDILMVLIVLVVAGVILSNLVIAKTSQNYNRSILDMQADIQFSSSPLPYLE